MIRLFLTLLALFTGLSAVGSPATARMAGVSDTEIGTVESVCAGTRGTVGQPVAIDAPVREAREREAGKVQPVKPRVYIPSVQFGADRAFE